MRLKSLPFGITLISYKSELKNQLKISNIEYFLFWKKGKFPFDGKANFNIAEFFKFNCIFESKLNEILNFNKNVWQMVFLA